MKSLSEIETTTKRASRAAGFSWGIAEEIGKASGRPCVKISMGGASNGEDYVGHGYTYEGSTYGLRSRAMMSAGCDNPVIIFDELDKVSKSNKAKEDSSKGSVPSNGGLYEPAE